MDNVLALDIGGTGFRSVILNSEQQPVGTPITTDTPNFLRHPDLSIPELQNLLLDKIVAVIHEYQKTHNRHFTVGISFASAMSPDGVAYNPCGIWGQEGAHFPLRKKLSERIPETKCLIAHDVTAAAERYAAKYRDQRYFQVITISSGIGAMIYDTANNKPITNHRGNGGDIGHLKLDFSEHAPRCQCGGKGHLEAIASGRGVRNLTVFRANNDPESFKKSVLYQRFKNDPDTITNPDIVDAIKNGDDFCTAALDHSTFYLAQSIAHSASNVGVDKFVIIGGFAIALAGHYLQSIKRSIQKVDFVNRPPEEIESIVEMGNTDGYDCLIGAGLMAQRLFFQGNEI